MYFDDGGVSYKLKNELIKKGVIYKSKQIKNHHNKLSTQFKYDLIQEILQKMYLNTVYD